MENKFTDKEGTIFQFAILINYKIIDLESFLFYLWEWVNLRINNESKVSID